MRKSKCCHQQTRPLNHKIIKKFCHICNKKFHDVDDNSDDSDDASDFDSDEEFGSRKFRGNAGGLDGDDDCNDHDNDSDDDCDFDSYDKKFEPESFMA